MARKTAKRIGLRRTINAYKGSTTYKKTMTLFRAKKLKTGRNLSRVVTSRGQAQAIAVAKINSVRRRRSRRKNAE